MRYFLSALMFYLGMSVSARAQVEDSTQTMPFSIDSTDLGIPDMALDNKNARKITLQESINLALENNYQLKQAGNNVTLANKQNLGAKADFLPSVSGRLSGQKTIGQQFVQATVSFSNITTNSVSGGLSANLPIFSGFRNIINLRRSNINEDYQQANKARTRQNVIFNAASGFLQVVLNQELLKISKQNLASSQQQLRQIKGQVEVGTVPSVDQYNQESTVATNQLNVIQQQNQLSFSKTQLLSTLQLNPEKEYRFVAPDLEDLNPVPESLDLSHLMDIALENRNDLKAQKLLIKRNRKDLGLSRANYFPTISATAGLNTQYNDQYRLRSVDPNDPNNLTTQKVGFGDQFFNQNVNKFFGLTMDVPIFNNLTTRLNVQQSKINYKNSQLEYENLKYSALEEVRQAYNDYRSYEKQLESSKVALRAARRSVLTQRERYKVGAGSLVEYSDANAQFVEAQSNRAQAILRFIFQQKLLDYYLGKLGSNISFQPN